MKFDEVWKNYEKHVLPPNAVEEQRIQVEQAFWAGADQMLLLLSAIAEESDEVGVERLQRWKTEIEQRLAGMVLRSLMRNPGQMR